MATQPKNSCLTSILTKQVKIRLIQCPEAEAAALQLIVLRQFPLQTGDTIKTSTRPPPISNGATGFGLCPDDAPGATRFIFHDSDAGTDLKESFVYQICSTEVGSGGGSCNVPTIDSIPVPQTHESAEQDAIETEFEIGSVLGVKVEEVWSEGDDWPSGDVDDDPEDISDPNLSLKLEDLEQELKEGRFRGVDLDPEDSLGCRSDPDFVPESSDDSEEDGGNHQRETVTRRRKLEGSGESRCGKDHSSLTQAPRFKSPRRRNGGGTKLRPRNAAQSSNPGGKDRPIRKVKVTTSSDRTTPRATAKPTCKEKPGFPCIHCKLTLKTKKHLLAHVEKVHTERTCSLCGKHYSTKALFIRHLFTHETQHEGVNKRLGCPICGKKFTLELLLQRHVSFHKLDTTKPLACPLCDQRFRQGDQTSLGKHLASSHPKHSFRCADCDARFHSLNALQKHNFRSHQEKCISANSTSNPSHRCLKTYLLTHKPSKCGAFTCSVCQRTCLTGADLTNHLLVHRGEPQLTRPV